MSYQARHDAKDAMPSEALRRRQGLLGEHIRNLSLPRSQPLLYDSLHTLLSTTAPLRQDMEESLDQLKEAFLNVVYEVLREGGIDVQQRLVLGFANAKLEVVERSHPQAATIDALLERTPMLATVLRQIAADTLMLRSLNTLNQAIALGRNEDQDNGDNAVLDTYQVCLKGALSHFYYA